VNVSHELSGVRGKTGSVKNVLLPAYTAGHFTELIWVARLLRESGRYAPTFWFWRGYYGDVRRHLAVCRAEGIPGIDEGAAAPGGGRSDVSASPSTPGVRARLARLARRLTAGLPFPVTAIRALARQRLELFRCRQLVADRRPDLVVLAEDGVGYETAALIKAAHERRAPSVIVPFTVCNALEPAESYIRNPAYGLERWENRLVAKFYPRWVYQHRGRRMLRLPAAQLLAKEFHGLAPPLPWQMNSGAADCVVLESAFMEAYFRREGLPASQLTVTGAITGDVLEREMRDAPARRQALREELGLAGNKPLILCALPPNQFAINGPQADAPDYQTLVRDWLQTLASVEGWDVVVCLHPRTSDDEFRSAAQWGVNISRRDTLTLVPLCDLFVAAVSAVIRWAIACGIPVLNYDVYRLHWTDFDAAPGVIKVEDHRTFADALRRLTTDRQYFDDVRLRQQREAPRWGRLDGGNGARILQRLDELIDRGASTR
jgi:hypothetical protein